MVHTSKLYFLKLKSSNLKSTARPESIAPSTFFEEAKHQESIRKQIRSGELEILLCKREIEYLVER